MSLLLDAFVLDRYLSTGGVSAKPRKPYSRRTIRAIHRKGRLTLYRAFAGTGGAGRARGAASHGPAISTRCHIATRPLPWSEQPASPRPAPELAQLVILANGIPLRRPADRSVPPGRATAAGHKNTR